MLSKIFTMTNLKCKKCYKNVLVIQVVIMSVNEIHARAESHGATD